MSVSSPRPCPPPTGRWAFLDEYIEEWFKHLMYAEAPTSTRADPRFDTFIVYLLGDGDRHQLLHATELVSYMLQLDRGAWWYAKRRPRALFEAYNPWRYDPDSLVPKVTFSLSPAFVRGDDPLDAVTQLHELLLKAETPSQEQCNYIQTKQRILAREDVARRLRGFQIPTQLRLQPPMPRTADELRSYLRDVVVLVRAFKHKCTTDSTTPFRLDAVALNVYAKFLSDVHGELRELLALHVPITISLRHSVTGEFVPDTLEWTANQRANVFPVFSQDPARPGRGDDAVFHTLDSKWISSSYEMWSAVAYSSTLCKVRVQPTEMDNPAFDEQVARWMGFALARSPSLRSLEIVRFRTTEAELDAMEAVLAAPVPQSLLASHDAEANVQDLATKQLIRLKPDAVIECHPGGREMDQDTNGEHLSLAELNIPSDWLFPVVRATKDSETVEFIVPGHAICAVPATSILSFHDAPSNSSGHDDSRLESKLTSLVIHNEVYENGTTARFVGLVGHKLRELRWYGEFMGSEHGLELQEDLEEIARVCPDLETLAIEETRLESLAMLTPLRLRELSLVKTPLPMAALVNFLRMLMDQSSRLARSLQRFTYYCPQQPLTMEVVDAVAEMLALNRYLFSVTFNVAEEVLDAQVERFRPLNQTRVTIERAPLSAKLAFLSVVHHHHKHAPVSLVGQLDNGCVSNVFRCLTRVVTRRIHVLGTVE